MCFKAEICMSIVVIVDFRLVNDMMAIRRLVDNMAMVAIIVVMMGKM